MGVEAVVVLYLRHPSQASMILQAIQAWCISFEYGAHFLPFQALHVPSQSRFRRPESMVVMKASWAKKMLLNLLRPVYRGSVEEKS